MYFPQYFAPHVAPMGYNPYACYQPAPQYARPMLPQVPQAFFGQYAYRPQHQAHPYNPFAAQYPAYAQPQAAQRVYAQYAPRPQPQPQAPQRRAYAAPQPQHYRANYPLQPQPAYNPYYTERPQPAPGAFYHAQPQPPVARGGAYARVAQQPAAPPQPRPVQLDQQPAYNPYYVQQPRPQLAPTAYNPQLQPQQVPATVTPPQPRPVQLGQQAQYVLRMLESEVEERAILAALRNQYVVSPEEAGILAQVAVTRNFSLGLQAALLTIAQQAPRLVARPVAVPEYERDIEDIAAAMLDQEATEEGIDIMLKALDQSDRGAYVTTLIRLMPHAIMGQRNTVVAYLLEVSNMNRAFRQGREVGHVQLSLEYCRYWINEAERSRNAGAKDMLNRLLQIAQQNYPYLFER